MEHIGPGDGGRGTYWSRRWWSWNTLVQAMVFVEQEYTWNFPENTNGDKFDFIPISLHETHSHHTVPSYGYWPACFAKP